MNRPHFVYPFIYIDGHSGCFTFRLLYFLCKICPLENFKLPMWHEAHSSWISSILDRQQGVQWPPGAVENPASRTSRSAATGAVTHSPEPDPCASHTAVSPAPAQPPARRGCSVNVDRERRKERREGGKKGGREKGKKEGSERGRRKERRGEGTKEE